MKQNLKGFTLIELLAVIVILAIIALIAVPVVMNIISRARQSASADTAYSVLKAAENYYMTELMANPNEMFRETTITFNESGSTPSLEIQGTKPTSGSITIDKNGSATIGEEGLIINGYVCNYIDMRESIACEEMD